MASVRLALALVCASVPSWSASLTRVEVSVRPASVAPVVLPVLLPAPLAAPAGLASLLAAPAALPAPAAFRAASPLPSALTRPAVAPLAHAAAARLAPAPAPGASARAAAPAAAEASETVELRFPNGRSVSVGRGFLDERGALRYDLGADGMLLDLGAAERSFTLRAGDLVPGRYDWVLFSHQGRVTRVQRARGEDSLVGGAARKVLVLPAGSARALGLRPGVAVPSLGAGSSVLQTRDALMNGRSTPEDYALAVMGEATVERRLFLDALIVGLDDIVRSGSPGALKALLVRHEILDTVAHHPAVGVPLRMQAETMLWKDHLPLALLRPHEALSQEWETAYLWTDTWVHESGHQLAARLFGAPSVEKRVYSSGAGFVTLRLPARPARAVAIEAAGGTAEAAVGASAAALGAWALLASHGWALAAAALPALGLTLFGLNMAYGSLAHAAGDLRHIFTLLGWKRAAAHLDGILEEFSRGARPGARHGSFKEVSRFYRIAWRRLVGRQR